ncbi:hypothetical protein E4U43_005786 [Claviceps pusilla]|uniref:lytic cellulose monooxygenase (C4-dehydrogenating) n=1 Tax=Claviceps pusilla TaxID=123648 RepID=A0A9P7N278_9HYPO|nr:hypothetical protein E4U43_005786 [Claviceps pusilla]
MAVVKFLLPLGYALTAAAHGRVSEVVIKGVSYEGYNSPAWASNPNPPNVFAWSISQTDLGFVAPDRFNSPDIICHRDAKPAKSHVEVAAGDILTLKWTPWPESHHGPVLNYLANCNGPCETVDKTKLEFFKIDGVGLVKQNPQTFGDDILIANDHSWRVQIPEMLAAGNYVLRHELIALHSGGQLNGAQAYPQCFNLKITGSGTLRPAGVKGTKLYKADDAGILSNIYVPSLHYVVPGPPLIRGVPASIPQQKFVKARVTSTATPGDASGPIPAPTTTLATSVRPPKGLPTEAPAVPTPCPDGKKNKGKKGKGKKGKDKGKDKKKGDKHKGGKSTETQVLYGQCGGINWTGATACVAGSTCKVQNPWYSQCVAA